jgi:hypothetical protein
MSEVISIKPTAALYQFYAMLSTSFRSNCCRSCSSMMYGQCPGQQDQVIDMQNGDINRISFALSRLSSKHDRAIATLACLLLSTFDIAYWMPSPDTVQSDSPLL